MPGRHTLLSPSCLLPGTRATWTREDVVEKWAIPGQLARSMIACSRPGPCGEVPVVRRWGLLWKRAHWPPARRASSPHCTCQDGGLMRDRGPDPCSSAAPELLTHGNRVRPSAVLRCCGWGPFVTQQRVTSNHPPQIAGAQDGAWRIRGPLLTSPGRHTLSLVCSGPQEPAPAPAPPPCTPSPQLQDTAQCFSAPRVKTCLWLGPAQGLSGGHSCPVPEVAQLPSPNPSGRSPNPAASGLECPMLGMTGGPGPERGAIHLPQAPEQDSHLL